ncbi:AMP dependent ligase [Culex quinquefasciatus]|uniref:AMP dependent ligase n=1 Tax=Culex quinquefasciatus TaxID=7176 RepID=B0X7Q4_CULQU|nr:AMP dependent ligase [Culex quinquefasciatus]|eukprot:XP_001865676.1 AMP dependent ligase [Culex quinquefasciatus]
MQTSAILHDFPYGVFEYLCHVHPSLFYTRPRVFSSRPFSEELLVKILTKYNVEDVFTPPDTVKLVDHGRTTVTQRAVSNLSSHLPYGIAGPLYGASEVGLISRITFVPGSVGALLRNVEMKIVDEAGYLYVVARVKDIMKYNGFKVSLLEFEAIIGTVEGVMMVCMVGVSVEDKFTDLVTAVIERVEGSKLTAEQMLLMVGPAIKNAHFVSELPKSASGKDLRRLIRDIIREKRV